MFKPKKLLKVVSVIMIIFSCLGLAGVAFSYMMIPKLEEIPGMNMELITSAFTPLNLVTSLVSSGCSIAAGIFGVTGKSFKGALIAEGIYTVLLLIGTIQTILTLGFVFTLVTSFILPLLYWWGLYQSKE